MSKSFFARYSLFILIAFFFAAPLLIQGAQRAIKSNANKVGDWLPKTFRETTELRWFRQHFVADQFVVISWEGCVLGGDPAVEGAEPDDPRIERLAQFLVPKSEPKPEHGEPAGYKGMFQSVTTARRLLNDLTSPPSEIPYTEALQRLTGTLIGPDGKQTCVVVMLSDAAIQNFRAVVGRHVAEGSLPWQRKPGVLWEALDQCGIDAKIVRLGGPPVENVAIDEEGGRTLARLGSLSALVGLALTWWALRSVKLTLIVFACGILSAAAGLSVVFWTGRTMDAVLMSMPSLLYVLAISGAVHLVNYYREAIRERGLVGAPEQAIHYGWKPAVLCSITTAVGLGSLYISDIQPISKFGIYSATGVMLMLVMLFLFLPSALQFWPARFWVVKKEEHAKHSVRRDTMSRGIWSDKLWDAASGFLVRNHAAVSIACIAFVAVVGFGVTRMHTSIDLLKLFDDSARVRQDYRWLEQHVGRLVPMEVVVHFPEDRLRPADAEGDVRQVAKTLSFLERLEMVSLIQKTIERELGPLGSDLVGPPMAAATFAPPLPTGARDLWSVARRNVTNAQLQASKVNLEKSGYLTTDHEDGAELWRVSLRAAAFANLDYGQFVESVRAVVEPVLAAQRLRERVLGQLVAQRPDEPLAGATLCVWDRLEPRLAEDLPIGIDSLQQIFKEAWRQLFFSARIRLTHTSAALADLTDEARAQLFEQLREYDCVAVVGPFSNAELDELREAGIRLVDARDVLPSQRLAPNGELPEDNSVQAVYTGVVPIVYKAQRALLENLVESSFWSFVTITPLVMLVSRSIAGGAVAMMPNVLPVLVVFGGMSWLGIPIDIGSMMSASIALGVAVDDTIHFLTWYRSALNRLRDRAAAIRSAYRHCAPPTIQAAMISGLGLSVFTLSTFTPTQRLGWLMMTILFAGAIAELVMLPALLAGPLGRAFPIRPESPGDGEDDGPCHDDLSDEDEVPVSTGSAHPVSGNGEKAEQRQPVHNQPEPHAWTLRDRLAHLRRSARDG